jgi:hypothetical protein
VLGTVETDGVAAAIGAMPDAQARAVLRGLAARIHQGDDLSLPWTTRRVWVEPAAVATLEGLAKRLGVKESFSGRPKAPGFDYY